MKNLPHLRMVVAELNHIWMNAWWYWCKAWPSASESCILQCSDVDIWCTILEFLFSHYRLINTLRLQIITFFMFCRVVFLVVNSWIKWMVSKTILSINLFTVCKCEVRSMSSNKEYGTAVLITGVHFLVGIQISIEEGWIVFTLTSISPTWANQANHIVICYNKNTKVYGSNHSGAGIL